MISVVRIAGFALLIAVAAGCPTDTDETVADAAVDGGEDTASTGGDVVSDAMATDDVDQLDAMEDVGPEDTGPEDTGPEDTGPEDTGPEDVGPEDTGPEDTGPEDTGPEDTGPEDTGPEDTGPEDTGPEDIGPEDVGPEDVGPEDVGPEDVGPEDVGPEDVGPEDVGPEDVGPEDVGPEDVGPEDTGPEDTGPEDTGPPPPESACNDGIDDDDDGSTDCADDDCDDAEHCMVASPCCVPHGGLGCEAEPAIEACVCAADPKCCSKGWDIYCGAAAQACDGRCFESPPAEDELCTGGDDEDNDGAIDCADTDCEEDVACGGPIDCCTPKKGMGCVADATIESCVCALDSSCCDSGWTLACAHKAKLSCSASCDLPDEKCDTQVDEDGDGKAGCEDPDCIDSQACLAPNACCETSATAGCVSTAIESCVCGTDPFCCNTAWDAGCVTLATNCGAKCGPTDVCCDFKITPGCGEDAALETCVCDKASECCSNAWDDYCIDVATTQCGSTCP